MTEIQSLALMRAPAAGRASIAEVRGLVHIVDDDAGARASLGRWLEAAGMQARTYACLEDLPNTAFVPAPQCLIVDMAALRTGRFGDRGVGWIRCPLIVIAHRPDIAMAVLAMKKGAADFVEKPLRQDEIVALVSNSIEADRDRAHRDKHASILRERFASLSRREQQVMALVTIGALNKQVGGALGVSEITVKAHRGGAMRKMGARTFAELVRMAEVLDEELAPLRNGC